MQKRGISPLIATVLIIGFTIVLAAIIFIWLSGSVEKIIISQEEAEKELSCTDIKLDIKKACVENSYISLLIENTGAKDIKAELFRLKGDLNTNIAKKEEIISSFGTKNFNFVYNPFILGNLNKIELFPTIDYNNQTYQCERMFEYPITDCPCPVEGVEFSCGSDIGECQSGKKSCSNKKWSDCAGSINPSKELCDNKDNDCDNSIDEGCPCISGLERDCSANLGICAGGKQKCENGKWSGCDKMPLGELCETILDDNCDGSVNENCVCTVNLDCGPVSLNNIGICKKGTQGCTSGYLTDCSGAQYPLPIDCTSQLDNDCNGKIDLSDATTEISVGQQPAIYNDLVVYVYGTVNKIIKVYNLTSKNVKDIPVNFYNPPNIAPKIYKDLIVWDEKNLTNSKYYMYLYNLTSNTMQEIYGSLLNEANYVNIYNDIIVWQSSSRFITIYNISSGTNILIPKVYSPSVYEGKISMLGGTIKTVYMCDLALNGVSGACTDTNKIEVHTVSPGYINNPFISSNKIIWFNNLYNISTLSYDSSILMCDLDLIGVKGACSKNDEKIIISDSNSVNADPYMHNNKIVWSDYRNENYDIYMYDLGSDGKYGTADDILERQLTTSTSNQNGPKIYDNKIIYQDSNKMQLYTC